MHLPPAAQWQLGRGRVHAAMLIAAAALQFLLLFFLGTHVAPAAWWGLLALASALLLHAGARWWKSPVGVLRWTGQEWQLLQGQQAPSAQVCTLRRVLDFETVVLVCVCPESGKCTCRWLWLELGMRNLPPWMALRRALIASTNATVEAGGWGAGSQGIATISPSNYLSGAQVPHLTPRGASVATSAGAKGFQDSTLR